MAHGWLTTALVLLPLAGAIAVWILPRQPGQVGATALLVALAEVGLWIESLTRFDFSHRGLQAAQRQSWFSDLHVSYHVGLYGFSLWLVGLTVVVLAASIGYGLWARRERPRAHLRLMLFLPGPLAGLSDA